MGLESLLLHKALEAQMALIGSDIGVNQDMSLHISQQGKFPATNSTFVLFHTLVSQGVLLQVVRLHKLHATFCADVWADVFVLHHVVLQLAWVLEGLITFGAIVLYRATVSG